MNMNQPTLLLYTERACIWTSKIMNNYQYYTQIIIIKY